MAQIQQSPDAARSELLLQQEIHGTTALLRLNRPDQRNALSGELMAALQSSLEALVRTAKIKAIVIAGNGPVFCAGHDLRELSARRSDGDGGKAYYGQIMRQCSTMMQAIVSCPKPVIAAVQGPATAAGCQLVASCDLAVAGKGATFCTPGVHIGLFCSTPMIALSRNVARKQAMEMLLLGEPIDADEARRFGLINRIADDPDVLTTAFEMAAKIAAKSAAVVKIGKEAFYRQIEMPMADAYDYASQVMVENMLHRDAEEGIGAFLEKRKPVWGDE